MEEQDLKKLAGDDFVLDSNRDAMLIKNIWGYAESAGIPPDYIWQSVLNKPYFSEQDIELFGDIFSLQEKDKCGVLYNSTYVQQKFMSATGLLCRNYINAKYMPVQEVLQSVMDNQIPEATVLFVPDMFYAETKKQIRGKKNQSFTPEWKRDLMMHFLQKRQSMHCLNIVAVSDTNLMAEQYGHEVVRFMLDNYLLVGAE